MKRKKLLLNTPNSGDMNAIAYSEANMDGNTEQKVVLKQDQLYYYDSSEINDLSVNVVKTLAANILESKTIDENSSNISSISSDERGKV